MIRPDQERFNQFSALLTVFDDVLERFCDANSFQMELNANRLPCRILRRQRRSMELIGIYLDGDWKTMEYSECLPCTFEICSYFETPDERRKLYKISKTLANERSAHSLESKIKAILQQSLSVFESWSPEFVVASGEEIDNLKRMYERGELG